MELKPLNVLIVDDSEDDALLIARRIRKAGYDVRFRRVETAEGMIDALGSDSWHAVIADVNLPCFSADAALDVYHRVQCDLAFIVVSGAVSEETAVSLLKAGAHDFVLKSNLARLVPALERELRDAEMRTAKRAAEEALRVSEERYALAARGVNDGLWDWSIRENHVHYSARWKAMLGCTEDEIGPGIHEWFDRIHPEDVDLLYQVLAEHLDGKAPGFACEHRVRHADGDWRWMLARGLAVRDVVGTPTRMAGSLTDVTARKSTELELRRVNEQLENAMSARMRFLAAASHDLRQPVQSLFFFTEALNRHVPPGQGRDYLGLLERGLDTLKDLLDRLLDVSRLDMGLIHPEMGVFPIKAVLDELASSYTPVAGCKDLTLQVDDIPDLHVRSDRTLLGRLLRNLIENAIRYTERGGVRVECVIIDGVLRIAVTDSGIGIPADHLDKIFEEFHQVGNPERDRDQGLGLGLAIVRRLSILLDHPIQVQSEPGKGSSFAIDVPLGKALNDNLPPVQRRHDCDGMGRLAVLVDDDTMVLMGLRVLFQEWGYDVLIAGSTDQAVELLRTAERIPDIVIADYRLRDGRFGTETIQSIRSLFSRPIPALILTGEIGSDCQDDVARHGFDVIYKPVVPKHLAQLLHRHTQHA